MKNSTLNLLKPSESDIAIAFGLTQRKRALIFTTLSPEIAFACIRCEHNLIVAN